MRRGDEARVHMTQHIRYMTRDGRPIHGPNIQMHIYMRHTHIPTHALGVVPRGVDGGVDDEAGPVHGVGARGHQVAVQVDLCFVVEMCVFGRVYRPMCGSCGETVKASLRHWPEGECVVPTPNFTAQSTRLHAVP